MSRTLTTTTIAKNSKVPKKRINEEGVINEY